MADGKVGAPRGNQNAAEGKKWKAAILRALDTRSKAEGREILDELANTLINQALAGEQWALREFGERMDGKSVQHTENKHEHKVEHVSDDQARQMAEALIDSARAGAGIRS